MKRALSNFSFSFFHLSSNGEEQIVGFRFPASVNDRLVVVEQGVETSHKSQRVLFNFVRALTQAEIQVIFAAAEVSFDVVAFLGRRSRRGLRRIDGRLLGSALQSLYNHGGEKKEIC
jgi:hypothetical protein